MNKQHKEDDTNTTQNRLSIKTETYNMKEKEMRAELPTSDRSNCPLFMDGLGGTNFEKNTGLAALASLLNDDVEEEVVEGSEKSSSNNKKKAQSQPKLKSGGGKVKKPTGKRNNHTPYSKEKTKDDKKKKSASLGEAQLFMNMWKI